MKTTYDFSFLSSPVNPRTDTKIAQLYTLGYLNSEPGTNFVFRFQPFTAADSRIDWIQIRAEHAVKDNGTKNISRKFAERPISQDSMKLHSTMSFASKNKLEAYLHPGFVATKEEAIAITYVLEMLFNKVELATEDLSLSDMVFVDRRHADEHIAYALDRQHITGQRRIWLGDALSYLVKLFDKSEKDGTSLQLQRLFERMQFNQESLTLLGMLNTNMKYLNEGISLKSYLNSDSLDVPRISKKLYPAVTVDMIMDDVIINQYSLSERSDRFDADIGKHKVSVSDIKLTTQIPSYTYASKEIMFGHEYGLLQTSEQRENISVIYKNPLNVNKSGDNSKSATLLDLPLYGNSEELYAHYSKLLQLYDGFKDEAIELLPVLFNKAYEDKKAYLITTKYGETDTNEAYDSSKENRLLDRNGAVGISLEQATSYAGHNGSKGLLSENTRFYEQNGIEGRVIDTFDFVTHDGSESFIDWNIIRVDRRGKDAGSWMQITFADELAKAARYEYKDVKAEHTGKEAGSFKSETLVNKKRYDGRETYDDSKKLELNPQESLITFDQTTKVNLVPLDSRIEEAFSKGVLIDKIKEQDAFIVEGFIPVEKIPLNARVQSDILVKMDRLAKESWIIYALKVLSAQEKAALINKHKTLFDAVVSDAFHIDLDISLELLQKTAKDSMWNKEYPLSDIQQKESVLFNDALLTDPVKLNGYIEDMMFGERPDIFDTIVANHKLAEEPERFGIKTYMETATKPDIHSIIDKTMMARKKELQREAYIPNEQYKFVSDLSDWNDIWGRYSPGEDVIDVPNSDFDYSKLASQVHDENGVPYRPLSPLNTPDVKVDKPLHHPIPQFTDVGTKEAIVDNYVIIDVILAIESLKNRSKLKYAGMPAEKALQDILNKLWTWIQQSAPGDEQYQRMFRMSRWYMEHSILKLSEHILHREYNEWISTFHTGQDFGRPYNQTGWRYYPASGVIQTLFPHAELSFECENYIDSKFTIRGYFDNPLGEGTMKVVVDDEVVISVNVNGIFSREFEIPQGNHTYKLIFDGDSGRVSLSSINIGGTVFVKAWTTSDDSNTNGLKAATLLINMLLTYFEQHHGDHKVKGNMVIKQRKLWQVT